jgi:hypothetical protein
MTLPAAGSLTLAQVAAELSVASLPFYMDRIDCRVLANAAAAPAPYVMSGFYGRTCITKTIGITAGNPIGYVQGNWGTISPDATGRTDLITQLYQNSPGTAFVLATFGTDRAQNWYRTIMLRPGTDINTLPNVFLNTNVAGYSVGGGSTFWSWTAAMPNWSGLAGQSVRVQIVY